MLQGVLDWLTAPWFISAMTVVAVVLGGAVLFYTKQLHVLAKPKIEAHSRLISVKNGRLLVSAELRFTGYPSYETDGCQLVTAVLWERSWFRKKKIANLVGNEIGGSRGDYYNFYRYELSVDAPKTLPDESRSLVILEVELPFQRKRITVNCKAVS